MKAKVKALLKAIVAVFIFIWISDWLIHGVLLKSIYEETMYLWRPQAEMVTWALFGSQAITALFFTIIFTKGYDGKGYKEGIRYGALMAAFISGGTLMQYAVSPMPAKLIGAWISTCFIQSMLAGVIAALAYGKSKRA